MICPPRFHINDRRHFGRYVVLKTTYSEISRQIQTTACTPKFSKFVETGRVPSFTPKPTPPLLSQLALCRMPDFKPKVAVQLAPPKSDPISLEELAKADGE